MGHVILALHTILAVFLIGIILLQRSEGGALGIGGGGGGFIGGRSAASALTRTTVVLAAAFFVTSIGLGFLSGPSHKAPPSVTDTIQEESATPKPNAPAKKTGESPAPEQAKSPKSEPAPKPAAPSKAKPEKTPSPPEPK